VATAAAVLEALGASSDRIGSDARTDRIGSDAATDAVGDDAQQAL
jgi:hypothetical protein